jgi:AcrR family transcriptional regulator
MEPLTAEDRRRRNRQQARRAIIEAAEALMLEGDGDDFSIRRVATRCGYSAPTIYHYFGDKDGLIDALLEERFGELARLVRERKSGADPAEDLREVARTYVEFGVRNPSVYRLLMNTRGGTQRRVAAAEEAQGTVQRLLGSLAADGRLLTRNVETAQHATLGLLVGLIALRIQRPDAACSEDVNRAAIELLLRGIISDPARSPNVPANR